MEGAVKSFHTSINGLATKVDSVVASTATPGRAQQQHQYHESVVKKEFDGIPYNEVLQFFHMDTVLENQQIAISLVSNSLLSLNTFVLFLNLFIICFYRCLFCTLNLELNQISVRSTTLCTAASSPTQLVNYFSGNSR